MALGRPPGLEFPSCAIWDDIGSASDPDVLDAAVIATRQVGLHYYIAAYGTLAATAKHLGRGEEAATIPT